MMSIDLSKYVSDFPSFYLFPSKLAQTHMHKPYKFPSAIISFVFDESNANDFVCLGVNFELEY